jgi:hypothetical protein
VSYYERIIQADFGFYNIDACGFKIVSNHPYGHGMIITDFSYNIDTHELTFANNLAGTVTETVENQKISDTLKRIWSDAPVELNWQIHPEWPAAGQGAFIKDMLEMTWEAFCLR